MKISLLGATGRLGKQLLDVAVLDGHDVHALVRRPDAVPGHPGVSVAAADVDSVDALAEQFAGSEAAVISLRADRDDPHLLERVVPRVAEAARAAGVRRVVHVSAFGAGETARLASWRARFFYSTLERTRLDDHARALAGLDASGLEWTTVLPIRLRDGAPFQVHAVLPMSEAARVPGLPLLPYVNVARTLLELATGPEHVEGPLLVTTAAGVRVRR